jgi:TPR repeat protein
MRRFFFVVVLVMACATAAAADSYEDAVSALLHGDNTRAVRLFRPLAEQGFARAQSHLAEIYRTGQGVPQGYQEALKWYRKAAKQGLPQAQSNLGVMYDLGQGVPQDYVRAHMWYSIAAATLSGDNAKTAIQYQGIVASRLT